MSLPGYKPILCLDFDGVIHSYTSGWCDAHFIPDPPVPGAIAFLCDAIQAFEVHIFSSRSHQPGGREAMMSWLKYWAKKELASDTLTTLLSSVKFPESKPSAMVTLDDRAITFTGEWPDVSELRRFEPWNKRSK